MIVRRGFWRRPHASHGRCSAFIALLVCARWWRLPSSPVGKLVMPRGAKRDTGTPLPGRIWWPCAVVKALRGLRRSYTRRGVWRWLRREVIDWSVQPPRRVIGWRWIARDPWAVARSRGEGMGT